MSNSTSSKTNLNVSISSPMQKRFQTLLGIFSAILYLLNLIFFPSILLMVAFFQFLIPVKSWRKLCAFITHDVMMAAWIKTNNLIIRLTTNIDWDVQGTGELFKKKWYFVITNHQSWVDILVLQKLFHKKIPPLKFFMKQELLWTLPFAAWVCWALDFPFMKRHSKSYLKKHPEKKGSDMKATIASCEKSKARPTTFANYLEGTRFTKEKHALQNSPYPHLLKPKAGGLAFTLSVMKEYMKDLINVTIVYPEHIPSFWDLACGRVKKIIVRYEVIPIPETLLGDYYRDKAFRTGFQKQLNQYWQAKDELIQQLLDSDQQA